MCTDPFALGQDGDQELTVPTYVFVCDGCGNRREITRPMADAGEPARCPRCLECMRRDYGGEVPSAHAVAPHESRSMGVPECVMDGAEHVRRRGGGYDTFRRDEAGRRYQVNPPGVTLNPKTGDVVCNTRDERRHAVQSLGMTDYDA